MEDNLARELEIEEEAIEQGYAQPLEQPYEEAAPAVEPIPKAEPLSKGLTKFEVALLSAIGLILFGLILFNIHSSLQLSNASREVQDLNTQITQTEIEVENLKQEAHELSRYDRINEIAETYGLELHDENIINIAPQE